ncbi:MAG TPA: hypothetical protein DCZ95_20115 [Verrucomicrobia bacterium]|nr:MAG: hypothetical protein A2X46_02960 [Lentisphaerae bacterium GWF2_57_35]HBA86392.1 hypothetical protein [Verrucomicrobiota bacterium]
MHLSEERASNEKVLVELAKVFLRLGATAFGGPAAHIAMMEQEFVQRRRWLTPDEFLDMLGLSQTKVSGRGFPSLVDSLTVGLAGGAVVLLF